MRYLIIAIILTTVHIAISEAGFDARSFELTTHGRKRLTIKDIPDIRNMDEAVAFGMAHMGEERVKKLIEKKYDTGVEDREDERRYLLKRKNHLQGLADNQMSSVEQVTELALIHDQIRELAQQDEDQDEYIRMILKLMERDPADHKKRVGADIYTGSHPVNLGYIIRRNIPE